LLDSNDIDDEDSVGNDSQSTISDYFHLFFFPILILAYFNFEN